MTDISNETTRKIIRRFGWFFFLEVILNSLDRSNVSFAALQMNADLGFDPKIYGYGVSLFFATYIASQLPAASVIERFGTRRALAAMMICWGAVAASMSLVQTKEHFYILRLCLGVTEAGAPMAMGLYAARWLPERDFARFMIWPNMAYPFAVVLGAPLSGILLSAFDGHVGWSGWRWMFLIEGLPTILLGFFALKWLEDGPQRSTWLSEEQKSWVTRHAAPPPQRSGKGGDLLKLKLVLSDLRLWRYSVVCFTLGTSFYGLMFWLPQVLAILSPDHDPIRAVFLSAVPWGGVAAGMILSTWNSARVGERHWHWVAGGLSGATGLVLSALVTSPVGSLMALTLAGFGVGVAQAIMWPMVVAYLQKSPSVALGLGFFNLISNLAGLSNSGVGLIRAATGSFAIPLFVMAGLLALGAILVALDARSLAGRAVPQSP